MRLRGGSEWASTVGRDRRSEQQSRLFRAFKFGLVGASGMVVNTLALGFATELLGIHYLASVAVATQVSTAWNYVLIDTLVFRPHRATQTRAQRFTSYWALNMAAMVVRYPLIWLLTSGLGVHYVISNLLSLIVMFFIRFTVSDRWIWAPHPSSLIIDSALQAGEPLAEQG